MASATKKCKVCGATYEYCKTHRRNENVFRWQDVACCMEHGLIYLERIRTSRNKPIVVSGNFDDLQNYDGEDIWFEDDFEDTSEDIEIEK